MRAIVTGRRKNHQIAGTTSILLCFNTTAQFLQSLLSLASARSRSIRFKAASSRLDISRSRESTLCSAAIGLHVDTTPDVPEQSVRLKQGRGRRLRRLLNRESTHSHLICLERKLWLCGHLNREPWFSCCLATRRHYRRCAYIISCIVPSFVRRQHQPTRLELWCAVRSRRIAMVRVRAADTCVAESFAERRRLTGGFGTTILAR